MTGISKEAIETTLRNKDWLQGVESVSALMVLIGAVATLATQKVVMVAAPLSFSIVLNLHHRRQRDRLSYQYAALRLTKIQRCLEKDLQIIQHQLSIRNQDESQSDLNPIQQDVAALTAQVAALETKGSSTSTPLSLQDLQPRVSTLKTQALHCGQNLAVLMQDLHNHAALTPVAQLADLKATVHRCQLAQPSVSSPLDSAYSEIRQTGLADLSVLNTQVQSLATQIEHAPQPCPADLTIEQIGPLQDQISDLYRQMDMKQANWSVQLLPCQESQQVLQSALKHLQDQLTDLRGEIARIKQPQLSTAIPLEKVTDQIEAALAPLQVQLVTLENQLDHLDFETQMTQHQSQQLQALRRQMLVIHEQALLIANAGGILPDPKV